MESGLLHSQPHFLDLYSYGEMIKILVFQFINQLYFSLFLRFI